MEEAELAFSVVSVPFSISQALPASVWIPGLPSTHTPPTDVLPFLQNYKTPSPLWAFIMPYAVGTSNQTCLTVHEKHCCSFTLAQAFTTSTPVCIFVLQLLILKTSLLHLCHCYLETVDHNGWKCCFLVLFCVLCWVSFLIVLVLVFENQFACLFQKFYRILHLTNYHIRFFHHSLFILISRLKLFLPIIPTYLMYIIKWWNWINSGCYISGSRHYHHLLTEQNSGKFL